MEQEINILVGLQDMKCASIGVHILSVSHTFPLSGEEQNMHTLKRHVWSPKKSDLRYKKFSSQKLI